MVILLLGFFNWMVNNVVRLTHLVLRIRSLIWESQENVSFGKITMRTMADGEYFTPANCQFYHSTSIELQCRTQILCALWSFPDHPRPKLTSAHLFVALIWDLYTLDHYFYVHLVFPLSLGHKFLGNKFCFPYFDNFHSVGYIVCAC